MRCARSERPQRGARATLRLHVRSGGAKGKLTGYPPRSVRCVIELV